MNKNPERPYFKDHDRGERFPNLDWNQPDYGETPEDETDDSDKPKPDYEVTGIPSVDASRKSRAEQERVLRELGEVRIRLEETEKEKLEAIENGMVDIQTGCFNGNFFEKYKAENFNPERNHGKLAIVIVDLNDLKKVNDDPAPDKGYAAGNRMLRQTAEFLKSNAFRADDVVVRLGGDEFIVICRNDNEDEKFGNNLQTRADEMFPQLPVSVAYGVAVYNKNIDNSTDLDEFERGLEHTKDRAGFIMHQMKRKMKGLD